MSDRSRSRDHYGGERDSSREFDRSRGFEDRGRERQRDYGSPRDSGDWRGGGGFGGRGGGGGRGMGGPGRGRGGKNKHAGDDYNVQRFLNDAGMSDSVILGIIAIPEEEKDLRATRPINPGIPTLANWRMLPNVGYRVRDSIVSNHFRVDVSSIPQYIYHYDVKIKKCTKDREILDENVAKDGDASTNLLIMKSMYNLRPAWQQQNIGFSYDGRSSLFCSQKLPSVVDISAVAMSGEFNYDAIPLDNDITSEIVLAGSKYPYIVELQYTNCVGPMPEIGPGGQEGKGWKKLDSSIMTALNSSILSFAKWTADSQVVEPEWFVEGSKAFRTDGFQCRLGDAYVAHMGYKSSFKSCLAGLVLICDITLSCFLAGGSIVDLMMVYGNFSSISDMMSAVGPDGFPFQLAERIQKNLKNAKLKLVHIPHSKKFRALGPPANGNFRFNCNGENISVAEYFNRTYPQFKLKYPGLPMIDLSGPKGKPNYVPAELAIVIPGQTRNGAMQNPQIAADMIRTAVVRPHERFGYLSSNSSVINSITGDPNSATFGLGGISKEPMRVNATLLPPAKLQYGAMNSLEPGLSGTWNLGRNIFVRPATSKSASNGGTIKYFCLYIHTGRQDRDWEEQTRRFLAGLDRGCSEVGMDMRAIKRDVIPITIRDADRQLRMCKESGADLVVVLLGGDDYNSLKYAADKICLTTQCVRWKNVMKTPSGYFSNLLLKINAKLGGINHTLASRLPDPSLAPPQFQEPPTSIAWLFDEPCMLMGVDVSHPEVGHEGATVCSVVASMDRTATQYCARVSFLTSREEIVGGGRLFESVKLMLTTFRKKNGTFPHYIIIYRDGVGDGSFDNVLRQEPIEIRNAIDEALASVGSVTMSIRFSIIVCQKRHNSRFAFDDGNEYINLCPGVCIDAAVGPTAVVSSAFNEFYLNSHVSIQGTAKPCRYSLIYDEINLKLPEIELLTYWTTYLYCRCNKSVSYAAPAYYAHWAAKRGRALLAAGATKQEVERISSEWTHSAQGSMFFV